MKKKKSSFIEIVKKDIWNTFSELGAKFDTEFEKIGYYDLLEQACKVKNFRKHFYEIYCRILQMDIDDGLSIEEIPALIDITEMVVCGFFSQTENQVIMLKKGKIEIGIFSVNIGINFKLYKCVVKVPRSPFVGTELPIFDIKRQGFVHAMFCVSYVSEFSAEQNELLKDALKVMIMNQEEMEEKIIRDFQSNTGGMFNPYMDYSKLN